MYLNKKLYFVKGMGGKERDGRDGGLVCQHDNLQHGVTWSEGFPVLYNILYELFVFLPLIVTTRDVI